MKKIFSDFYLRTYAQILLFLLPFLTLGLLGEEIVLYLSASIEAICLLALIARFFTYLKNHKVADRPKWADEVLGMMTLPYSMALSSLILIKSGIEAQSGIWLAIIFTVLIILAILTDAKKTKI